MEIKNLIDSYTSKLSNSKSSNLKINVKLPKLLQNHSYHNLIIRKIEKLRASNVRNRYNSGEKRIKSELPSLFSIHRLDHDYFRKFIKIKNIHNKNYNQNINFHTSLNSLTSNSKTAISNVINNICEDNNNNNNNNNSNNNFNLNINNSNQAKEKKIKIIKIKQVENSKNSNNNNKNNNNDKKDNDNNEKYNKIISDCCFIKKNFIVNKINYNKDIFNLINTENFHLFNSKISKTPKNELFNALLNKEVEKNGN